MADTEAVPVPLTPCDLHVQWLHGLRIAHIAHSRVAATYALRGRVLGLAVAVIAVVIGTTIFSSLVESPAVWAKVATGMLSLVAAAGASAQTFLEYPQKAERHRRAAVEYGVLRRRLEVLLSDPSYDYASHRLPAAIEQQWDRIDTEAPPLPPGVHDAAYARVLERPRVNPS